MTPRKLLNVDATNPKAVTLFTPYFVPEGVLKLRAAIRRLNRVIRQGIQIPAKRSQPSALSGQSQRSKRNGNEGKCS
jgi:hypothetical protein